MGKLLLDSLEIQNFRGFRHLQIEKLGRVNLIVGKNNIGKSSLLEALELYAHRGQPNLVWDFLQARNELHVSSRKLRDSQWAIGEDLKGLLDALRYLFYGMEEIQGNSLPVSIGSMNNSLERLTLSLGWWILEQSDMQEDSMKWRLLSQDEYLTADNAEPRFTVEFGGKKVELPIWMRYSSRTIDTILSPLNCVSIKANGLKDSQAALLWDKVTLTDLEEEVISALRIIAPGVKDLSFISHAEQESTPALYTPAPYIRLEDMNKPLPIGNLGNGLFRLLGIVLAMANAKDGILLIDEIENGIHYSVQQELWEVIFRLARRLNIQVFATTHSWDCIEGLQYASAKDQQEEGMLIRLSLHKEDEIKVTLFDERRMGIAAKERIEVR